MFASKTLLSGVVAMLLLAQHGSSQLSVVDNQITNCENVTFPSNYVTTYAGWPFQISCNWFLDQEESRLNDLYYQFNEVYEWDSDHELLCHIWSENGTLLFNASVTYDSLEYENRVGLHLDDLEYNSSLKFMMTMQVPHLSKCLFSEVQLHIIPFEQLTCQEVIQNQSRPTFHDITRDVKIYDCSENIHTYPKILQSQKGLYRWERNCSNLPKDVSKNDKNQLIIPSVSFDHAGFYTCSVTYKGMTRYIVTKPICVIHHRTAINPALTCTNTVIQRNRGKNATFSCTGNLGKGEIDSTLFFFSLKKLQPNGSLTSNVVSHCDFTDKTSQERVSCRYTFRQNACFLSIATEEERENGEALVAFSFTIKNLTNYDYGTYILTLNIILEESVSANVTLILSSNPLPSLMATATIAGIGVGALCFFLIFVLIIIYNLLAIRVYLKRYYGSYLPDDKKYGAFLCYNFSQEIDSFAQEDVRKAMWTVRHSLETMGYKVYDERREGFSFESRAENIRLSIARSHRVVILLSLEFIKDGWSMLALQAGFDEMIKSGSKLILILLPGIKEYIKQHQKDDEVCLMIQTAIKLNYAIPWSSKKSFNKKHFNLRIEDAMPKLKSQKMSRMISTSSNGDVSLSDFVEFDIHNFQRCFSNETDITDIDVPRTHCDVLKSIDEHHIDPSNAVV